MRRRIIERWARARIAVATFAVAVAVAVLTAVLALVVEDLLPVSGARRAVACRWILLAAALVALGLAIWYRNRLLRDNGTVCYAQVLDEVFPDVHATALGAAARRRAGLRTVTEWVDVARRTPAGIVDAVEVTTTVGSALTALLNTGLPDVGSTIAPNMLWPVAVGVGYRLPGGLSHRLLELGAGKPGDTGPRGEVDWSPGRDNTDPGVLVRTITRVDGTVTKPQEHADRLGLMLAFASAARFMHPEELFAQFGVRDYVVLQPTWISLDRRELVPGCFDSEQMALLGRTLPESVATIKKEAGERELVVAAALTKTLAFALGSGLAARPARFFAGTHLLHWERSTDSYVPMRVRPSQPDTMPA